MMASAKDQAKLDAVEDVDIDDSGKFKYVLIKLYIGDGDKSKHVVRGFGQFEYHADIYEDFQQRTLPLGIDTECLGGGRIQHDEKDKKLFVYGYSMGFGRADHSITVELLKAAYPDYTSITFSNDGY